MSNSGLPNKLLANKTLCNSPPDKFARFFESTFEIFVSSEILCNSSIVNFFFNIKNLLTEIGIELSGLKFWGIYPIDRLFFFSISPLSGLKVPIKHSSKTDFPAPLGPIIVIKSFFFISIDTFCRISFPCLFTSKSFA